MINNEELKMLNEYFSNVEVPKELENLVKRLNLINQIRIAEEKLQQLVKESNK